MIGTFRLSRSIQSETQSFKGYSRLATIASSLAYTLCIVLCICSLQTVVTGKKQKIDLTLYAREIQGGINLTLVPAAGTGQGNFTALGWGSFLVFDNMLKDGGAANSKLLGKITDYFRGYSGYALTQPNLATTVAPLFVYKWNFYLSK